MKISHTLSRYLAKNYMVNLILLTLALFSVIYLFDTVELLRRASKHTEIPLSLVLEMGLLKLPEVGQTILPFAVLFSAIFTFWQLTRRYELIVVRASGFSVWQFLAPVLAVAVAAGFLQMTIINPVGALLIGKFQQLEKTYLKQEENQIALLKEGLWLRQGTDHGYMILHAGKINQADWSLQDTSVLFFDKSDQFLQRIDAPEAQLEKGQWIFHRVNSYRVGGQPQKLDNFSIPTSLTAAEVEDSFSSPAAMSFWRLPAHIRTLKETGFDASRLRVHYQSLLAQPLMFAAMILLAASVSMRPPRFRGAFMLIVAGIMIGFVVFFLSSFLQALGSSRQIPVVLASWSPALISMLLGLSVVINLEDG